MKFLGQIAMLIFTMIGVMVTMAILLASCATSDPIEFLNRRTDHYVVSYLKCENKQAVTVEHGTPYHLIETAVCRMLGDAEFGVPGQQVKHHRYLMKTHKRYCEYSREHSLPGDYRYNCELIK